MSADVTFEKFENTVFEFTKALVVNDNSVGASERNFEKATKLAKEWYQSAESRETAFQELLTDLNDKNGATELQKRHYATAGERVYK